jgi:hypothetical protein
MSLIHLANCITETKLEGTLKPRIHERASCFPFRLDAKCKLLTAKVTPQLDGFLGPIRKPSTAVVDRNAKSLKWSFIPDQPRICGPGPESKRHFPRPSRLCADVHL